MSHQMIEPAAPAALTTSDLTGFTIRRSGPDAALRCTACPGRWTWRTVTSLIDVATTARAHRRTCALTADHVVPAAAATQRLATFDCPSCGARGSEPTHAPDCWRRSAAQVLTSATGQAAREALADYQAREVAGTLSIYAAVAENDPNLHLGRLSRLLAELLATIDTAAGA